MFSFTTNLLYTLPYACAKSTPSVIISYINTVINNTGNGGQYTCPKAVKKYSFIHSASYFVTGTEISTLNIEEP